MTSTVSPRSVWLFPNSRCLLPSQRPSPPHGARILRRQQQSAKPRGNPARGNPLSSHGLIIRTSRAFGEYFRYLTAAQSRCYLFPIYRMSRELDFEGLRDDEGRLFTPTATPEWERPNRVELRKAVFRFADAESELKGNALKMVTLGPELHIETSRREAFEDVEESRIVRPKPDLLERFIRLAKASDGQIRNFAMRYGGLEIFFGDRRPSRSVHIEYCEVWRYFARVMEAVLKIGARLYARQHVPAAQWKIIGRRPRALKEMAEEPILHERLRSSLAETEIWCSIAGYLGSRGRPFAHETRSLFIRLLNTLMGMAMVRPWIVWPDISKPSRPQVIYSGRSLLSTLALQLCLRVAKIPSSVLCFHCQKSYRTRKRAPKIGQRNFCPACRRKRMPQKYALADFRQHKRGRDIVRT